MVTTLLSTHPIVVCADAVTSALDDVADVEPVYMSTADKATALEALARADARLAELRLRVMATADDVADEHGARDAGAWLAHRVHAEPRAMRADLELAHELDRTHDTVAAGMRAGAVSTTQARVITQAVEDLPDDVDLATRARAEAQLVDYASEFRPSQLRRLGRRILEVVAPEVADEEDAKILAAEERRARDKASLRFMRQGDGTTRLTGLLPDHVADRFKTYLEAVTSPRRRTVGAGDQDAPESGPSGLPPEDQSPLRRQHAHGFEMLLEHLDPTKLPHHGGDATTVMVTLTLDQLRTDLATAGLLDQGRARRLFTPAQRKAMRLRDKTCRAEGCEVPATWTEAHHLDPWSEGGRTDLDDGILLCCHHHHRAHDQTYRSDILPSGDLRFHRRQ